MFWLNFVFFPGKNFWIEKEGNLVFEAIWFLVYFYDGGGCYCFPITTPTVRERVDSYLSYKLYLHLKKKPPKFDVIPIEGKWIMLKGGVFVVMIAHSYLAPRKMSGKFKKFTGNACDSPWGLRLLNSERFPSQLQSSFSTLFLFFSEGMFLRSLRCDVILPQQLVDGISSLNSFQTKISNEWFRTTYKIKDRKLYRKVIFERH